MEFEWTERLLNIPKAVAAKYARPGTQAFEELVSAGNEAIVRAAAKYRPMEGVSPSSWLFRWAKHMIKRSLGRDGYKSSSESRWRRLVSLDEPLSSRGELTLGGTLAATEVRPGEAVEAVECGEFLERALSRLSPQDRTAYVLHVGRGVRIGKIASRLGCSRDRVRCGLMRSARTLAAFVAEREEGTSWNLSGRNVC